MISSRSALRLSPRLRHAVTARTRGRASPPAPVLLRHLVASSSKPISDQSPRQEQKAQQQPLCLGYVAGLQSQQSSSSAADDGDDTRAPWSTFDEAYSILQQVDPDVLYEFESNIWHEDGMKFIHSTKQISVLDMRARPERGAPHSVRSLVFNTRPKLIQSSIEIEDVGAEYGPKVVGSPPPLVGLTATHLGGLALAVPLWLGAAGGSSSKGDKKEGERARNAITSQSPPRVVVLGAGGCTIPAVLAESGCNVTAIEPNEDVRTAALKYFGASDAGIDLLAGYGEEYLKKTSKNEANVDILIIDAEDGMSAPPGAMKDESFWKEVVAPSLASDAVVAINVIADADERVEFQRIVDEAMPLHDVWSCDVPSVAEVSPRHSILFATPTKDNGHGLDMTIVKEAMDAFDYVDMPSDWIAELEHARVFRFYRNVF